MDCCDPKQAPAGSWATALPVKQHAAADVRAALGKIQAAFAAAASLALAPEPVEGSAVQALRESARAKTVARTSRSYTNFFQLRSEIEQWMPGPSEEEDGTPMFFKEDATKMEGSMIHEKSVIERGQAALAPRLRGGTRGR